MSIAINNAKYWWKCDKGAVHSNVIPYIQSLWEQQPNHELANLKNLRLYGNYNVLGLTSQDYNKSAATSNRVTLNIVQSMCDTAQAKIAQQKPKPSFLTEGGDWSLQTKAKKLNKFILGQFMACDIYQVAPKVFMDACVFGTGIMKVFTEEGKITVERVFPNEIVVDDTEAIYGKPRQLHQVKEIPKEVLLELFPNKKDIIEQATYIRERQVLMGSDYRAVDLVTVVESWHLPGSKKAKDGRHTITLNSGDLVDEEYKKDHFPFVFIKWTDRLLGFFGQGLAEQLTGIQIEINKILRTIQLSMHLTSIPKVFVEKGSGVVVSHLNNEIGGVIHFTGKKPSYESVGSVPPELAQHLNFLFNKAYEITGISQMSAQAVKPAGLDSGVALREYNDIQSERFAITSQAYENLFMEAAGQMISLARDLYKQDKDYAVKVKDKKFIQTIRWDEVNMEEDQYELQMYPANLLPSTPAGRFQRVVEMIESGFINKDEALQLLDVPDIQHFADYRNAPNEYVEKQIELMLDLGEYNPPEPYTDLQKNITITQYAYIKAKNDNAPEERLELLRRFMEDSQALMQMGADSLEPPVEAPPMDAGIPPVDPLAPPMGDELGPLPEDLSIPA